MRNNTKKGFTLVELLVVIAILAILATVSVVGYTSFIEGSAVKVDADFATQLNHFLAAYKVNNKVTINEDNIDKVTADILDLAGVDEIEPQAGQYGYHFYYDFKDEQYKSLHDDVAITGTKSPVEQIAMHVLGYEPANGTSYKTRLGNCFTVNGQYYLVDTTGDLAEAISSIVNFAGKNKADVEALGAAIEKLGYEGLTTYVDETVFVTETGSFVLGNNRKNVVIVDGVLEITNKVNGTTLAENEGIVANESGIVIKVPASALEIANGSLVVEGAGATIVIPAELTREQIEERYEAGFTGSNVTVQYGDKTYVLVTPTDLVNTKDSTDIIHLEVKAVIEDFDLLVKDMNNKTIYTNQAAGTKNNVGYVAWNHGNFQLQISANEIVNSGDGSSKVSSTEVIWEIVTEGLDKYITIDKKTGEITYLDVNGDEVVDRNDYLAFINYLTEKLGTDKIYFTVKATSVYSITEVEGEKEIAKVEDGNYENCPYATMDVRLVTLKEVGSVQIKDLYDLTSESSYMLSYSTLGQTFDVVVDESTIVHNWDGEAYDVELEYVINLGYKCLHTTTPCCVHGRIDCPTTSDCMACLHEQAGHKGSNGDCSHPSDNSGEVVVYDYTGGARYACTSCPEYEGATGKDAHWCYDTSLGYLKSTMGSCGGACQKDRYASWTKPAYPGNHVHNEKCCAHTHQSTDTACLICIHNHTTDICTGSAETCAYTTGVISGTTMNALANMEGELTVTVDGYEWGYVKVTFIDLSDNALIPTKDLSAHNNVFVGKGNSITAADLFDVKDGKEFPTNAYLVVFTGDSVQENYMNLGYAARSDAERKVIALTNGLNTVIDLSAMDVSLEDFKYRVVLFVNPTGGTADTDYVRISEDVVINLVDGYNIHKFQDLVDLGLIKTESKLQTIYGDNPDTEEVETNYVTGYKHIIDANYDNLLTSNIVLWDNIKLYDGGQGVTLKEEGYEDIRVEYNYLTVGAGKSIYGNCFNFDITNGRITNGIIVLNGTLRDTKVTGALYTEFAFSVTHDYGSAAITANGGAQIINSYISNTRAPVRVNNGKVTIEDTILFGGRYANLDIVGGEAVIKGNVVLIQKPVEYTYKEWGQNKTGYVIGLGVSVWFNDSTKTVSLFNDDAELIQYNFLSEDMKDYLPELALKKDVIIDDAVNIEIIDITKPFEYIFSDSETSKKLYTSPNGDKYLNTGMVALDAYYLNYGIIDNRAKDDQTDKYAKGDEVTLRIDPNFAKTYPIDANAVFVVTYPEGFVPKVTEGKVIRNNTIELTGAELKAGVVFVATQSFNKDTASYSFHVASDAYKTLVVDDFNGKGYDPLIFNFDEDLRNKMTLADSFSSSMHSRGLHYGYIFADVRTPTTHTNRFNEYIEYVEAGHYDPENYGFTNGSLVIKEIVEVDEDIVAPDDAQ